MDLQKLKTELEKIEFYHINDLKKLVDDFNKIIIIGNGGSNSIASHISQDYTKVLGKKAMSFSDPSRLTCYINDYGRDEAYKKYIEHFADKTTLVILISSSGNSMNIINTAKHLEENKITYIALSGFDKDNKLNTMNAKLKYWVDSKDYGIVENIHQILLHSIL